MRLLVMVFATMLLCAMAAGSARATDAMDHWYGGEYSKCDGSTADMVSCINGLRDKWDVRLNASYRRMMANEEGEQKNALRNAQRQWIAYRDANCAYYAGGEGSIARVEAATCDYVLTRDRAQELEMMSQEM